TPALSEAMTTLQHTLLGPHRARGAVTDSFGVLLELAERIRLELTALTSGDPDGSVCRHVRLEAADLLDDIGRSIGAGTDVERTMARSLQNLLAAQAGVPTLDVNAATESARDLAADAPAFAQARHFHALCGQLAAAARNAGRASTAGARRAEEEDLQLPRAVRPQSPVSIVVASLTPRSAAFRHALRTAVCLAVAVWIGRLLGLSHGYWIPMTVAIVLRAEYGSNFSYGLLRVAGTVMGLLLTTALLHFLPPGPWVRLAVMAVFCACFRYFGTVHYGVAVTALTGMVVLLLALAGEPAEPTMVSRLIATVVGSAMALAAYGLWPTREREQIRPTLVRLLRAYASYVASLGAADEVHERREARNDVRVARANAEAALARLLAEPAVSESHVELAQSLLTNSNRLARTTMTLDAARSTPLPEAAWAEVRPLLALGAGALEQIAEAVARETRPEISAGLRASQRELARKLAAPGAGGIGVELATLSDRLVDNINTLAHVVARGREAAI
ncbi:MAG: FUSC family protein, partial [Steroidobacteraceae bacterium]